MAKFSSLKGPGSGPSVPAVRDDEKRPTAFTSLDPPRNFTLTTEQRVRALAQGVPIYAERKRRIEDLEAAMVKKLCEHYDKLVAEGVAPDAARRDVHERARAVDLSRVNALIEKHNRYYPIEANLPVDPRTGAYLLFGRRWHPERPWTLERLLEALDARLL